MDKPISNCTATQLIQFIEDTIGDNNPDDFYVFVDDFEMEINLVNKKTNIYEGISACKRFYR